MFRKLILLCLACVFLSAFAACNDLHDPQMANEDETLAALFTPDGAEVTTNIEDLLILDSTQSLTELIDFYKSVLSVLYVQETGLNDKRDGIWIYSGIYDGSKPITIEMRDGGEAVRVYIIY